MAQTERNTDTMARKASTAITATDDRLKLIEALRFALIATKDNEGVTEFVSIRDHWLSAENDTYSIGVPVDVALELSPQADKFKAALEQCGAQFQLTQIDLGQISIRSGNFRATVPALSNDQVTQHVPDANVAVIDDNLKDAFRACVRIKSKDTTRLINTCVMLQAGTMQATNGAAGLEYWHGIDLPGPLNIPRKTAEMLAECSKPLAGFGFSNVSATFYFNDMSYVKSRLITGDYPNLTRLLDQHCGQPAQALWPEFYVGLKAVSAFVEDDTILFQPDTICTHSNPAFGASYRIAGLPTGFAFAPSLWKAVEPFCETIKLNGYKDPCAFYGKNVRGLIMGKSL